MGETETAGTIHRPVIFSYSNYRTFLRDYFDYCRKCKAQFSHRYFAQRAGFRSSNFLMLVIEGKRNLTIESTQKIARGFHLTSVERDFLIELVNLAQADSEEQRALHLKKIERARDRQKIVPLEVSQYEYYRNWFCAPIREMVAWPTFQDDPDWIRNRLREDLAAEDIRRAIETLRHLGFIEQGKDGRLEVAETAMNTANEVSSQLIADYHKEMIARAADSIDTVKRESREISSVCMSISNASMMRIKERMQEFREEILAIANADSEPESVYQLNMQLFPLTRES